MSLRENVMPPNEISWLNGTTSLLIAVHIEWLPLIISGGQRFLVNKLIQVSLILYNSYLRVQNLPL